MKAKRHFKSVLVNALALGLISCGGTGPEMNKLPENKPGFSALVPRPVVREIEHTNYSGIEEARNVVVSEQSGWEALWKKHKSPLMPLPPVPAVDFSEDQVIAVFLGNRSNGCYGVKIDSIDQEGDKIIVRYTEKKPSPESVCIAAIVQPAHIVIVHKSSLPYQFNKER